MSKDDLMIKIDSIFNDLNKNIEENPSIKDKNGIKNFCDEYRNKLKNDLNERKIKESEIITIEKEDIDKFINFNYKKLRKGKEYILKKLEEYKFDYKKSKEALGLK